MAQRNRSRTAFMDELMAERIPLPGAPQVIVTRGWAYQWLRKMGYSTDPRDGFASIDYMVFRRPEVEEPLTDLTAPHIVSLIALMESRLQ